MKQQLNVALAGFTYFAQGNALVGENFATILAAARLVERLLPGECAGCKGSGEGDPPVDPAGNTQPCLSCSGSGQVWDEGIVEAVAKAISLQLTGDRDSQFAAPAIARAVLSALVELLTEKVER